MVWRGQGEPCTEAHRREESKGHRSQVMACPSCDLYYTAGAARGQRVHLVGGGRGTHLPSSRPVSTGVTRVPRAEGDGPIRWTQPDPVE